MMGATKILSSEIQMDVADVLETGGYELAKSRIGKR